MSGVWSVLSRAWRAYFRHNGSHLAAGIAYYLLFSLVPLATLFVAVLGFVLRDPNSQAAAVERVIHLVPLRVDPGSNLVLDSIRSVARASGTLGAIGLVGLLWASSGIFGAVRDALNVVWGGKARPGFVLDKLVDFAAVVGLGLMIVVSVLGTLLLGFLGGLRVQQWSAALSDTFVTALAIAGVLLPATISFIAFLVLYRYAPNVRHRVRDIWPGALVAAILFELFKHGFAFYVAHYDRFQVIYGALGAVMLFLLWVHISAMVMMFGAELSAQYANRGRAPVTE